MISSSRNRKSLVFVGCVLLAWSLVSVSDLVSPVLLPSPAAVCAAAVRLFASSSLALDLAITARRVCLALFIAAIPGIPLGLIFGYRPRLYAWFEDTLNALRSVPATCLFPLLLIVIGVGEPSIIVLAAYPCFLLFLVNSASGARLAEPYRIRHAEALGAGSLRIMKDLLFFEAMPHILAALRTCVSYALVLVVAVEMFIGVGKHGLGRKIFDLQSNFDIPETYAAIIVTGLFGVALNTLVNMAERRLLHWMPQSDELSGGKPL
jgi:NitT/TauT family transport system permease protein